MRIGEDRAQNEYEKRWECMRWDRREHKWWIKRRIDKWHEKRIKVIDEMRKNHNWTKCEE